MKKFRMDTEMHLHLPSLLSESCPVTMFKNCYTPHFFEGINIFVNHL